jgi:hypothetical protein
VGVRGLLYIRCLSLLPQCDLHFCLHLQCVLWLIRPMSGGTSTTMRGAGLDYLLVLGSLFQE